MQRSSGFSLMELMIVVTIIGVLAALAGPRFMAFASRSRQSEMRANLSALARSEIEYFAAHQAYTDDMSKLGWRPEGAPRYLYGFTSNTSGSGVNDSATLRSSGGGQFSTTNMVDVFGNPLTGANLPAAGVSAAGFTLAAVGNVDTDVVLDQWTVNDADVWTNVSPDVD
jgi:prepilin-type N-terminal cleavage/methylation domain-containing protein